MKQEKIPFYREMLDRGVSLEDISFAGYFDDKYTLQEHDFLEKRDFITIENLKDIKCIIEEKGITNPVVNFFVGCFAPFHDGHLEAIKLTREMFPNSITLICPAHESYIKEKGAMYTNGDRLRSINRLVIRDHLDSVLIETKPFSDFKYEVNFPYILNDLLRKKEIMGDVKINFIMGDDNAGFALALENTDITPIVVERTRPECIVKMYDKLAEYGSKVEPIVLCNSKFKQMSSRYIREKLHED